MVLSKSAGVKIIVYFVVIFTCLLIWIVYVRGITKIDFKEKRRYLPTDRDLKTRPLPLWYDKAKIGIMVHIGIYSVSGYNRPNLWEEMVYNKEDILFKDTLSRCLRFGFKYQEFAPRFKAEFFNAKQWANLFAKAGAKYVIFTSKNVDGFRMFPSKQSPNWNSVVLGAHRDFVGELSKAVKEAGMEYGLYYALTESFNSFLHKQPLAFYNEKIWPELKQLVNEYKPSILWGDFNHYENTTYMMPNEFIAWLYNDSPVKDTVVVNDRWHTYSRNHYGDFYSHHLAMEMMYDDHNHVIKRKWEGMLDIDTFSYGNNKKLMDYNQIMSTKIMIFQIIVIVSQGGNVLINFGASRDGTIPVIIQDRLLELGSWLQTNGEAIYGTSPWIHLKDSNCNAAWYTCKKLDQDKSTLGWFSKKSNSEVTHVFVIFFKDSLRNNILSLQEIMPFFRKFRTIRMLGAEDTDVPFIINGDLLDITIPNEVLKTCKDICSLKFTNFLISDIF